VWRDRSQLRLSKIFAVLHQFGRRRPRVGIRLTADYPSASMSNANSRPIGVIQSSAISCGKAKCGKKVRRQGGTEFGNAGRP